MTPIVEGLENGLTVVMRPTSAAPVVAFQVWLGVGSTDERSGEEGLAHVLEHMLFKGTKRRPVGEITRDVERAGGQINAWTSFDETVYYVTLASRYQDKGLDILADAVQNATLDAKELARELMVIQEEIRMGEDSPEQVLVKDLFKSVYRQHPYGRPVIGYDHTVRSFTRNKVVNFYRRWYVPENTILSIAGDFEPKRMLKKVQAAFAEYRSNGTIPRSKRAVEPAQRQPRFSSAVRPISEAHLALAFPIPGVVHEDVPALDILAGVVGQGMSSRLERIVRRELGLVSDIRAMAYTPRDSGVLAVFATCPQHQIEKVQQAVAEQLAILCESPITSAELKKAQTMIESDSTYSEETVDGLARKSGFYLMHAMDVDFERKYTAAVSQQGVTDITQIARRYISGSRASVSVVLPDPGRRGPAKRVAWISGSKTERKIKTKILKGKLLEPLEKFKPKKQRARATDATASQTRILRLSSGDTLIVRSDPASKLVAARAAFMGGVRLEPKRQAGLFALLANSLVRGTDHASADEIATMMDGLACSISGFSGRNTIGIHGEFLSRNFADGFTLMAACLRFPSLPKQEIEREKQLLIEEIRESEDNPSKQAFRIFYESLYGKHPYSRLNFGNEKSVTALSRNALQKALLATTQPGNMVLAVVGGVDAEEVAALAETLIVSKPSDGPTLRSPGEPPRIRKSKQVTLHLPKEQSHVLVGFQGSTLNSADRFSVEVLVEMLGGHGGRLFEQVRENKGLAYAVTAFSMEGIEPGYIGLYAGTSPGGEAAVVSAMTDEVMRICDTSPPVEELRRVKRHLIGTRAIAWQRTSTRAASLSLDELYGIGYEASSRYADEIDAVTGEDVVEAARKYLDLGRRIVVCVGPKADSLCLV